MTPAELHKLPPRDRTDYYREQAVRALQAAGMAKEPMARASLFRIAEAWGHLARHCTAMEDSPSVLTIIERATHSPDADEHSPR